MSENLPIISNDVDLNDAEYWKDKAGIYKIDPPLEDDGISYNHLINTVEVDYVSHPIMVITHTFIDSESGNKVSERWSGTMDEVQHKRIWRKVSK